MTFNRAVLRKPGKEIVNGVSQHASQDKPNFEKALQQHNQYAATLKQIGVQPIICEAQQEFPDGCFTEDTHLILPEVVIQLNPGTRSRANEPESLKVAVPDDRPYKIIPKNFTIDGGDILVTQKRIYIGLSSRTKQKAIDELESIVSSYDYQVVSIAVPDGLHLKSGMTCLNSDVFIIQETFKKVLEKTHRYFDEKKMYFVVPPEEDFAANILVLNNCILIPPNCPQTKEFILKYFSLEQIHEVDTSEFRKVDGALTCLSIPYFVNN